MLSGVTSSRAMLEIRASAVGVAIRACEWGVPDQRQGET